EMLDAAYLDGDSYAPEIVQALDENGNGKVDIAELKLDTDAKVAVVAGRLADQGLEAPRIQAEVQPYSINHNVAGSEWATRDCETCHTEDSRLAEPVQLAGYVPGGVIPQFVQDNNTITEGEMFVDDDGALYYQPAPEKQELYIFGHNSISWIDWFGVIMFLGVLGGVSVHGGIRAWVARKQAQHHPEIEKIYMYTFYERLWHWLQALTIFILAFTGLVIHKPEMFGMFSFKGVVLVHNIMAGLLVANAVLALSKAAGFLQPDGRASPILYQRYFQGRRTPLRKNPPQPA
ncbi:MAG: cytochrome b/b6 domain-containing protein, partial [Anaerolineales bacterium]